MHVKEFLSSETFEKPVDFVDIKERLFEKEGRITGSEYAMCATIIGRELQKTKGLNYESK